MIEPFGFLLWVIAGAVSLVVIALAISVAILMVRSASKRD